MSKPSFYDKFIAKPWIRQIDELIQGGYALPDVFSFVRDTLKEFPDVNPDLLKEAIQRRKSDLDEKSKGDGVGDVEFLPSAEPALKNLEDVNGPRIPRRMGEMSSIMYRRLAGGVNTILEIESAILMYRDRIDEMVRVEAQSGTINEGLYRDLDAYRKLLFAHAELRKMLGLIGGNAQDSIKVSLDVQGIGESFGKGVAEAIMNPASRAKVLAIVKKMQSQVTKTEDEL